MRSIIILIAIFLLVIVAIWFLKIVIESIFNSIAFRKDKKQRNPMKRSYGIVFNTETGKLEGDSSFKTPF